MNKSYYNRPTAEEIGRRAHDIVSKNPGIKISAVAQRIGVHPSTIRKCLLRHREKNTNERN
jgi:transposase-like protein